MSPPAARPTHHGVAGSSICRYGDDRSFRREHYLQGHDPRLPVMPERPAMKVSVREFTDIIGRHFRQPAEGLGFDGSPVAHMWRTLIYPNSFL
jgi:hypothetical protein